MGEGLGTVIERRHGEVFFLALVVCLAVTSNLGQYFFGGGGTFGGMSGVVYGLFGYIWMRSKTDPASGFYMPSQTVAVMLVWFVVCVAGIVPRVANTAHGVGLAVGAGWGIIAGRLRPTPRQPFDILPPQAG